MEGGGTRFPVYMLRMSKWRASMSRTCPDILLDMHAYLDKNECEKSQLVSRDWGSTIRTGRKHLRQRRLFTRITVTRKTFVHHYRPSFPTYLALLENPLHEVEKSGRIKVAFRFKIEHLPQEQK